MSFEFTTDDAARLCEVVGMPLGIGVTVETLATDVARLGQELELDQYLQDHPSARDRLKAVQKVSDSARRLLSAARIFNDHEITRDSLGAIGPGALFGGAAIVTQQDGAEKVVEALQSVRALRSYADAAEAALQRQITMHPKKSGPARDQAVEKFIAGLDEIYALSFHRPPGQSRGASEIGGPFIRFLSSVYEFASDCGLAPERTNEALSLKWRQLPEGLRFGVLFS